MTADFNWQVYNTPYRSYDAQMGRFHQIDPLADIQENFNPYHYGYNNPVSWNDPTGLVPSMSDILDELLSYEHGGTWSSKSGYTEFADDWEAFLNGFEYIDAYDMWDGLDSQFSDLEGGAEGAMSRFVEHTGNTYRKQVIPFYQVQPTYLMIEGVGIGGTFNVKGAVRIYQDKNGNWKAAVLASGQLPAVNAGNPSFFGFASLLIDGKSQGQQPFKAINGVTISDPARKSLGRSVFDLPPIGRVQVQVQIGYFVRSPEGRAVPVPASTTISIRIPVGNAGQIGPGPK